MKAEEQHRRSLTVLCSLSGYSRLAYYQHIHAVQKEAYQSELIIQQVLLIRKTQKKVGTRKLLLMMNDFFKSSSDRNGQGCFF
jgi:hypothetical protein